MLETQEPRSKKPVLAFFGATGGVAGSALALALKAGYTCTALARTPSKLTSLLTKTYSVPQDALDSYLTIHSGDIKDPLAVAKALTSPLHPNYLVDSILFSVGAAPKLQLSLLTPVTIADVTICEDGMNSLLSALSTLFSQGITTTAKGKKPLLAAISTTGLSSKKRDVPIPMNILYRWMLAVPHKDKEAMEKILFNDAKMKDNLGAWVVVKPPAFTDGNGKGVEKVRAGWVWGGSKSAGATGERDKELGPVLGWTMDKRDVGDWVFKRVLETDGEGWGGKCVTLSY